MPHGTSSTRRRCSIVPPVNIVPISTLDDPRLRVYANMRDAELAQRTNPLDPAAHQGLFIAEGELVVRRLIRSPFATQSILTTPTRLDSITDSLQGLPPHVPIYLAEQSLLNNIVGFNMHRGLLAVGIRSQPHPLAHLIATAKPILVLEDTNNHDNLGGIFRNAACLAGPNAAIILSPRCTDPFYRKCLRVSMGCVLHIPFARATNTLDTIAQLKSVGVLTLAMTPGPGALNINDLAAELRASPQRIAIVLGAEGPGLSPQVMAACDHRVIIPMNLASPYVDSLNVHVASAIALHRLA